MQRWQLTTGLAAITVLAALVVPSLPSLLGGPKPPAEPQVTPPPPTPEPPTLPEGILKLEAGLDQSALLQGSGEDRYLVVEVSAPELPGDVRRPVHLAVVMDVSGSMAGRGKIDNARMAASELVDLLGPADTFSLVTFSDRARVIYPSGPVTDLASTHRLVRGISPGGGTNLYDGLQTGLAELESDGSSGVKRVIILSDGMANIGITDHSALARAAGSKVREGISVSGLGLGLEYNEDLLAAMSDAGGGRYRFVDRPGMLSDLFAEELRQMTAVAGREASIEVDLPDGIEVMEVFGYDAALRNDGYQVFLGDVHGGETRKIVARVRVAESLAQKSGAEIDIADVEFRYTDADSGQAALAQVEVDAEITQRIEIARRSVKPTARKSAVRAHAAKLLDEGTRAFEKGDLAGNEAKLEEGEKMLRNLSVDFDDAEIQAEAMDYRRQKDNFQAAQPSSDAGMYQVKKSKEVARDAMH